MMIESLWRDPVHGIRTLRKSPGFTLVVVVTLALGIGANTAVFSVVDAALLRRLPYPSPDRVVILRAVHRPDDRGTEVSPAAFLDWRRESRSFAALGARLRLGAGARRAASGPGRASCAKRSAAAAPPAVTMPGRGGC
jgi:hypothetical protein